MLSGLLLIITPAYGLLPPIFVSDVNPASFTINSRSKVLSGSDISIYIHPDANTEITEQLQITPYPLYSHSHSVHSAWEIRKEKESVRQIIHSLNISQVAVSGCMPSTTYYFTVSSDQKIYSVTTALHNRFIYHAPQLIVHFPHSHDSFNPDGFLVLAISPLAMYPVSAIVGDGISERAIVNLSNLFDADGINLNTDSGVDIQVIAQGEPLTPVTKSIHLESSETFDVATSYSILMNTPPTFIPIASQQLTEDQLHQFILKTNDLETAAGQLMITAQSSNTALIPDDNIKITYTGADYIVSVEPARFQSGSAFITLTISDAYDVTWTTFMVNVQKQQPALLGDFNEDGKLALDDLIIVLQVLSSMDPSIARLSAAIDSEKIMIEDAIYIIFKISGIVYHSGDYNPPDFTININEMLRLIQLHNADGYHCDSNSEDGYAIEKSDTLIACPFHSSDFAHDNMLSDWMIDDLELNRFIEFYNADGYVPDNNSMDGFRPK